MGDLYNNMDKHIREKMQSKEFEVGSDQWAQMNQLLDKQAAVGASSSAWKLTAWLAGGGIAAVLTGWLLWQGLQQPHSAAPQEPLATELQEAPRYETRQAEERQALPEERPALEQVEKQGTAASPEEATEGQPPATPEEQPMALRQGTTAVPQLPDFLGADAAPLQEAGIHQSNENRYLSSQRHPFTATAPEGPQPKPKSRPATPAKAPKAAQVVLASSELPQISPAALQLDAPKTIAVHLASDRWGYGFKGGLSLTHRMNGTSINPLAGAFVSYSLGAQLGLQLEANYRAFDYPQMETNYAPMAAAAVQQPGTLSMLELPLVLRYKVLPLHHLNVGVRTSLIAQARSSNGERLLPADMGATAINASLLLGYELSLGKHISMELRYHLGLSNMQSKAESMRNLFFVEGNAPATANQLLALETDNQLVIPSMQGPDQVNGLLVSRQLRNSDLQLSMYYRF